MDAPRFEPSTLSIGEWLIDTLTHSATTARLSRTFFSQLPCVIQYALLRISSKRVFKLDKDRNNFVLDCLEFFSFNIELMGLSDLSKVVNIWVIRNLYFTFFVYRNLTEKTRRCNKKIDYKVLQCIHYHIDIDYWPWPSQSSSHEAILQFGLDQFSLQTQWFIWSVLVKFRFNQIPACLNFIEKKMFQWENDLA